MTFLHKLARRLASIATTAIFSTPFLASCTQGTTQDYLGPDPHKPSSSVTYIGLSVTPDDPQLVQGDSVRLEARGWLPSGQSSVAAVSWSGTGGVVSSSGWFRATVPGTFRVRAVVTANPALADSVSIVVIPPGSIARLDITPSAVPLAAGTQQQFTAVVLMGDGSRMYPTVSWSATGGSITSAGLFTAPGTEGSYTVTASTIDGALLGRTDGLVGPAVLRGLALAPGSVILESGATFQFTASAAWSDGSTGAPSLTWTATGGAVTRSGVYTAGATAGSFRVIASGLGKADTAKVTILPATIAIRLSPLTALLALEATQAMTAYAIRSDGTEAPVAVQWSAEGGTISPGGIYTAGVIPGTYAVVGTLSASGAVFSDTAHFQVRADEEVSVPVFVRPDTTVPPGATVQFVASSSTDGSSVPAVSWSATGGSISSEGLYTAGPTAGSYRVVGKRKNGNKADTATVVIQAAPVLSVSGFTVSPQTAIIASGESRSFSATLSWSDGKIHPCDISWVSAGGTITQNGLYTAGTLAGTFLIIATGGCGVSDTASVSIPVASAPAATLSKVVLTPSTTELNQGASQVFTVAGVWSDGATSPPPVTFTATGGSITPAGGYVAGTLPGTYRVIATQTGGSLADTSVVVIRQGASTLTGLVLNPSSATVPPGATQAFVVSASWSDGSSTVPPVTFTATGGTVSVDGVYTAGTTPGSYRLIATHTGGTKADTSTIVIPSGVTLTRVILNPSAVAVAPGGTQQMVVTGSWSDGSSLAPPVTYTATGGTISPTGLYAAGSTPGTFQIIAVHTGGTKADTSGVTIGAGAPPPPTGWAGELVVFPNPQVEFIIGAQLRTSSSANPWPWFDQTLVSKGLEHGAAFPATPAAEPVSYDNYMNRNYYDLGLALYTTYYKTGDARFLTYARKVTDSWWLSPNINQGTTGDATSPPWFTPRSSSLGGMMLRALDGRPEMWPWITNFVRGQFNVWVERPMSGWGLTNGVRDSGYMLLYAAWLAQVHPSSTVRAEFRQKALDGATKYFARLQALDGGWYWDDPDMGLQGISQPFMVGLLLEGMVATHQLTNDPAIAQAIIRSANWLYNVAFEKQAVTNLSGVYWRAMKYFVYKANPTATAYTSAFLYGVADGAMRDNRQLNPHSVHVFGYAYKLTGDPKYVTWGDDIFAATFGKGQGPGADAYSSLADYREKEFNAAYRSAGRYLVWRSF